MRDDFVRLIDWRVLGSLVVAGLALMVAVLNARSYARLGRERLAPSESPSFRTTTMRPALRRVARAAHLVGFAQALTALAFVALLPACLQSRQVTRDYTGCALMFMWSTWEAVGALIALMVGVVLSIRMAAEAIFGSGP